VYGYMGRILRVDLSTGKIKQETFDQAFARSYIGGNGFIAKLIFDGVPAGADPLGEENAIVFGVGPINNTGVPGSDRFHIGFKSPLTSHYNDGNSGGSFSSSLKKTGFDAVYISGKSEEPVYLLITEHGGVLKSARELWGKDTYETAKIIQESEGKDAMLACIGPAGENCVLFANVVHTGWKREGFGGRGGAGAVMGAKKVKAVVARGNKRTEVAYHDKLRGFLIENHKANRETFKPLSIYGTPRLLKVINNQGLLGTHNNQRETFQFADDISGELIKERYFARDVSCRYCPVGCGKDVNVPGGEYAGRAVKFPEYETLYALGSMMDCGDIVSIFNANGVCNYMGLDTISMGVTLSFVAECLEAGICTEKDIGGKVAFGDGPGMVELIKKTAHKEGIGELLSMGSNRIAERIGKEAWKLLYTVKGLEIAGHSARGLGGMALCYATSTRGGSHHDARPTLLYRESDFSFENKAEYVFHNNHFTAVNDSLVLCRFISEGGFGPSINQNYADLINFVTGWDVDENELEIVGERIYNLERLLNVREGISRRDDTLPYRVMNVPIPDGPARGRYVPQDALDKMLDRYYQLRGWNKDGIPSEGKLTELGLK